MQTNSFTFLFIYHSPGFVSIYAHTHLLFPHPTWDAWGEAGRAQKNRILANQIIQKKIEKKTVTAPSLLFSSGGLALNSLARPLVH